MLVNLDHETPRIRVEQIKCLKKKHHLDKYIGRAQSYLESWAFTWFETLLDAIVIASACQAGVEAENCGLLQVRSFMRSLGDSGHLFGPANISPRFSNSLVLAKEMKIRLVTLLRTDIS